jgi:hypothetical protein
VISLATLCYVWTAATWDADVIPLQLNHQPTPTIFNDIIPYEVFTRAHIQNDTLKNNSLVITGRPRSSFINKRASDDHRLGAGGNMDVEIRNRPDRASEFIANEPPPQPPLLTEPLQDFYDPSGDLLKEPRLPGSSYSFTSDGHFEEALYIVVPNRQFPHPPPSLRVVWGCLVRKADCVCTAANPGCPTALLQWQHGEYTLYANGSLVLTPIKIDGRQILSDPCNYDVSIYTRYNQTEIFKVRPPVPSPPNWWGVYD